KGVPGLEMGLQGLHPGMAGEGTAVAQVDGDARDGMVRLCGAAVGAAPGAGPARYRGTSRAPPCRASRHSRGWVTTAATRRPPTADVEGHDARAGSCLGEGVEEGPGLLRRPRAKLHEGVGTGGDGDVVGVGQKDLALAPGEVVLLQGRDLVEQRAAGLVVEP